MNITAVKMAALCIIITIMLVVNSECVYADGILILTPRSFSVEQPDSWVRQPTTTANSRIKFSSPKKTPSAECAVVVKDISAIRNISQNTLNQLMLDNPPNSEEMATILSSRYNNVKMYSAIETTISGLPAQQYGFHYSLGTPNGELWTRGITLKLATTPGLEWSVGCGGLGRNLEEAKQSYSYWQSVILNFLLNFKLWDKN